MLIDSQAENRAVSSSTLGDQHLAGVAGSQKCDGGSHCANKNTLDKAVDSAKMATMR